MLALPLIALVALATSSYTVVLTDGSALRALSRPQVTESLAVATLDDGTLVSLPASRIDWDATEVANRPRLPPTEPPTPPAKSVLAPRRAVVSNETITGFNVAAPARGVPPPSGDAALTTASPAKPVASVSARAVSDKLGRDPEYWRERARTLRDRRRAVDNDVAAARASLAAEVDVALHGRKLSSSQSPLVVREFIQGEEERAAQRYRISVLEEAVREAEAHAATLRAEQSDLAQEARVAGADPGWLRLP